jgi:transposase
MMTLFLRHLADTFRDYFIVLLVDRAGWHRAKALVVPENIRLLAQPAYSPEVNPAEHLWEELRKKTLPNLAFRTLDGLVNKLCAGIKDLAADPERVRSMTDFPYLRITL